MIASKRTRKTYSPAAQQRGIVLFVALIALVAMTLAAIALVRSVDTGNVISGNFAFRQGGLQASDLGTEIAFAALPTIAASGNTNVTTATYQYYATRRIEDNAGIPTTIAFGSTATIAAINWNAIPLATPTTANGYNVRVVIERLCVGADNVLIIDIVQFCSTARPSTTDAAVPQDIGEPGFNNNLQTFYRATVQVTGPRNTTNFVQSILAR